MLMEDQRAGQRQLGGTVRLSYNIDIGPLSLDLASIGGD